MATLSRIAPEIPVVDLKKAIDYYRDKLGFELVVLSPGRDYAVVERDGIAIHLFEQAANPCGPAGVHLFTHQLEELHNGPALGQPRFSSARLSGQHFEVH